MSTPPHPDESQGGSSTHTPVRLSDFDYTLPEELIAQHPPAVRGGSRLLDVDAARDPLLVDRAFSDLPDLLQPGDLLVMNDTGGLDASIAVAGQASADKTRFPKWNICIAGVLWAISLLSYALPGLAA